MTKADQLKKNLLSQIVIADGGLGTLLQEMGLANGQLPELLNLEKPEWVLKAHQLYYKAGARIITTNSFGANAFKLSQFGLKCETSQINIKAAYIARQAIGHDAYVAGSVGPTGVLLRPMGNATVEDLEQAFKEQISALLKGGVDLIILETMSDLGEMLAAARICRRLKAPFICSMTYNENLVSLSGSSPQVIAATMEAFEPIAIGSNCGMGPGMMKNIVQSYVSHTHIPILAEPNAGLPELIDRKTVFTMTPDEFAARAEEIVQAGAAIIGGCCGTKPDHIALLSKLFAERKVQLRKPNPSVRFTSRTGIVSVGPEQPFCIVGERINPTGRKKLTSQLIEMDFTNARRDAKEQVSAGAGLLDINVGVPNIDESVLMVSLIEEIQTLLPQIPLSVDSNNPEVLTRALSHVVGRPLLNSVNGEKARMDAILPVISETGANFIALAMDEKGIPENCDSRIRIIKKILKRAENYGIARNRILVDCLVFTVGSNPEQAVETLKAISIVKSELGCATVLGVSNVSFGLPRRAVLSSTFLAMALVSGLDAGIINPLSGRMMENLRAAELLLNRDPGGRNYVNLMSILEDKNSKSKTKVRTLGKAQSQSDQLNNKETTTDPIALAILEGDKQNIVRLIIDDLQTGASAEELLKTKLVPSIQEVGRKFGSGEIYLPQLILAGETMKLAVSHLKKQLKSGQFTLHNTVFLIGTVEGDIHDIGKNIVGIVLENQGFRVIDLGKDVTETMFIDAIKKYDAKIVGLSALMTTTMPAMESTVKKIKAEFKDVKVIVGGAVVTKVFSESISADGYAKDAVEAGVVASKLAGISQ